MKAVSVNSWLNVDKQADHILRPICQRYFCRGEGGH